MPSYDHLQSQFNGGEITPRLWGRVESDLYKRALAACLNWEALAHGPLSLRGGTGWVRPLTNDPRIRIITLRMGAGQDFLLELFDHALRLYALDGAQTFPEGVTTSELVTNGDFSAGGNAWTVGATAYAVTFADGVAHLVHSPSYPDPDDISIAETLVVPAQAAAVLQFDLSDLLPDSGSEITVALGTTPGGTDLVNFVGECTAHMTYAVAGPIAAGSIYLKIRCHRTSSGGPVNNRFDIDNVSVQATYMAPLLNVPTPWTLDQLQAVQYVSEPGQDRVFFTHGNCPPWSIQFNAAGNWDFGLCSLTNAPAEWTGANWPSVCEIYQGRLYLAATPASRNHIWASRVGFPLDFSPETGLDGSGNPLQLASDEIDAKLSTKGALRWLHGRQMLLVGTDLGEHSISAQSGVVTPTDLQVRQESAFGSAAIQAEDLGDQVMYVSTDLRKIRGISYAFQESAWHSHDLTVIAEHITAGAGPAYGIKEIHFARDPNLTIVVVLRDGTLACCTYDRSGAVGSSWQDRGYPITAWWRASTQGSVLSACVSHGVNGSLLYLAVQRTNGVGLEVMPMNELAPGRCYLDAALTLAVPAGDAPVVAGLDHLNGVHVRVILDGALEEDQVVQGGQIQLARAGASVTVGLAFPLPTAQLLPLEGGNPRGTSQASKKKWLRCALRLNDSALPKVNGVLVAPDRSPSTPMDTAEPRYTGDVVAEPGGGWDTRGQLTITQDLPFRTEILAIFGSVRVNEV